MAHRRRPDIARARGRVRIRRDEVRKANQAFEKERRWRAELLKRDLEKPGEVDPKIRNILIKLMKLPFVYTMDACEGHFSLSRGLVVFGSRSIDPARFNAKNFYYQEGSFDIELNISREAVRFKSEIKRLASHFPFVELFGGKGHFHILLHPESTFDREENPLTREGAIKIQKENILFFRAFESLIGRFASGGGRKPIY